MVVWNLAMSILVKYYHHFRETSCLIFYLFPRVSFVRSFMNSFIHSISVCSSLFLPLFFPSSLHPSCLFLFSFLTLFYPFSPFFFLIPPFVSWKLHVFDKPRTESCQIYVILIPNVSSFCFQLNARSE